MATDPLTAWTPSPAPAPPTAAQLRAHHLETQRMWERLGRELASPPDPGPGGRRQPRFLLPDMKCRVSVTQDDRAQCIDMVARDVSLHGACLLSKCALTTGQAVTLYAPLTAPPTTPPVSAKVVNCLTLPTGYRISVQFVGDA